MLVRKAFVRVSIVSWSSWFECDHSYSHVWGFISTGFGGRVFLVMCETVAARVRTGMLLRILYESELVVLIALLS